MPKEIKKKFKGIYFIFFPAQLFLENLQPSKPVFFFFFSINSLIEINSHLSIKNV